MNKELLDVKDKKTIFFLFIFFIFERIGNVNAATTLDLQGPIISLCSMLYSLLAPISLLLVVAAAATYAAGQLASAETRAKATGWATAMIVGALFAFILVSILPPIIKVLYGEGAICEGIVFD